MNISRRPARLEDLEWLDPFYEGLMRPYVEITHRWDTNKFRENFDPERVSIIQVDDQEIGMLRIDVNADHIYLGDLQIASEYQRKGIGSVLLKEVIQSALERHLPIRLRVLKGNPAISLYERYGFIIWEEFDNSYVLEYSV
ncbi:GNAT family N-acetyltransferase [Halomonas elongata]|uniref:GNAT family N-acetyltransferase n=1 Tax=Halomonas elongata TaxID=2746 RepID=UPI00186B5A35|nr:GNAT family N-acetyltransferase [Halomonas elongata]MBW5798881.1 GNAT family N-acetyltransferase [Halomonas elongata]